MDDVGVLTLFLVTAIAILRVSSAGCPELCQCLQRYFVYCRGASLTNDKLANITSDMPAEVRLLDLGSNHLENVSAAMFSHFSNLEYLNLSDNRISQIEDKSFLHQTRLRDLNLYGNRLASLSGLTFHGLSHVKELNLGANNIRSIDWGTFSEFTILQELYLHKNKLDNISSDMFVGLDNLHMLDLSENAISTIGDKSFRHFKKLWKLRLSDNQLREVREESFSGLPSVRELDLSSNHLSNINFFATLTFREAISGIDLSHNSLKHIPAHVISTIRRLEVLDLSHNLISSISPNSFFGLSLRSLNLSGNSLARVDRGMFAQARKIRNIDLSYNSISVVKTGAFDSFRETVHYLNLHSNRLTEVNPGMFRGMKKLWKLNLDYNYIDRLYEGSFRQLAELEELRISNNRLTTIRAAMLKGPPYQLIHLQGNPVEKFSGFKFEDQESPVSVLLNMTAVEMNESSVRVRWPYREGSQIYWKVSIRCVSRRKLCVTRHEELYLAPYKREATLENLLPNSKYYICVYPVFVNKNVAVDQCVHVSTRPSRSLTTVTVKETLPKAEGQNGASGLQCSVTFIIVLYIFLWT